MTNFSLQGHLFRAFMFFSAVVVVLSYLLTATLQSEQAHAALVLNRSITLASSEEDTETNYTISFTVPEASTIGAVLIEFCDNNPIPHDTCDFSAVGDDIPQVDGDVNDAAAEDGTNTAQFTGAAGNCADPGLTAPDSSDKFLLITCTGGTEAFAGATTFSVQINNIDNPSNATDSPNNPNNTFYARLYVFDTNAPAEPNNTAGTSVDTTNVIHSGGIAMSTAEQLTITARVQEVLEFCVGDTANVADDTDDCSDVSGNDIDLGVLDFASVSTASVEDGNGYAMVRTNAASGVVIDYFANNGNANDSEGDGFNDGHMAVSGQNCDAPASLTDQCINSVGDTEAALTAGTENFGMTVDSIDLTAGANTANLVADGEYDNDVGYSFDGSGATDRVASSATVVDDEMLVLDWAATASITTPTGVYSTVLTFIATSTY